MALKGDHIIVVGAGFSGSLFAINLLRHDAHRVTLIERAPSRLGRGVAYGTAQREHVLNVRAANMSAFPDQPDHFIQWLEHNGQGSAGFVRRSTYGAYLDDLLQGMIAQAGERIRIVRDEAVALDPWADHVELGLASGERIRADIAVLAPGNLPPHDISTFGGLADGVYVSDPWSADIAAGLRPDATVLLIGTGLTAVDCVLTLDAAGFEGRIVAMSRRGLAPRAHAATGPAVRRQDKPPVSGSALVRHVRERARAIDWRSAIDELRPYTQDIWGSADVEQRQRFLRHLRPYWDVHRHRIAPPVAEIIARKVEDGTLSFLAGKVQDARLADGGATIDWRPRGKEEAETLTVDRIINCTGPQGDILRSDQPLLRHLVAGGHVRPDALRLGIDVDARGRTVKSDGTPSERIFALGPMTRGAYWEIVAVPDLRRQAWDLSRQLTATYWVGGEGL